MLPTPARGSRTTILVAVLAAFSIVVGAVTASTATAADATPTSLLPAAPTIQECGARRPSDVELDTDATSLPASPVNSYDIPLGGDDQDGTSYVLHRGTPDEWYVKNASTFLIYLASDHSLVTTFSLPSSVTNVQQRFAVDPDGNVYVMVGGNDIDKFDGTGKLIWTRHFSTYADGLIFGYGDGAAAFRVAVATRNGAIAWNSAGTSEPTIRLDSDGGDVTYDQDTNRIDVAAGQFVAVYDASTLERVFYMDAGSGGTVGGGIAQGDDGNYLVDNGTLQAYDTRGILLGTMNADPGSHGNGDVDFRGWYTSFGLIHYQGRFYDSYLANDNYSTMYLGSVPDSLISTITGQPAGAPFGLGAGASITTGVAANYFPYGTAPKVTINFGSWWAAQAGVLTGQYTVRSMQQILANDPGTAVPFGLPTPIANGATGRVNVALASTRPGYYEVDVRLLENGTSVSADCLRYSIGAQGQRVDFSKLAAGGDARGVAVAAAFGQKIFRSQYNLAAYLPSDNPADTTPMDLSSMDADVKAAAAEAAADGVVYEMQLATGGSRDQALVSSGRWQARVREWVSHFRALGVHAYEAWNEPNNTYGNGTDFTDNVLKPFYNGVKAADPSATVIGGGILDDDYGYFSAMVAAGALDYMDAAGVHPYTGHNRSFEEQGILPNLQKIQALFAAHGKRGLPLYATESGFWNTGPNQYYDQGDKLIRKEILMQSIGMNWNANFYNDGGYLVDNQTWALLDGAGLTAAGLASLTYAQYTAGRPFVRMLTTGVPHTYAAEYGASSTATDHIVAVWSDDYTVGVVPALSAGGTIGTVDEWGGTGTYGGGGPLSITGSVTYLQVPAGETLTILPAETYGTNYALATNGGTASASSHARNGSLSYGYASWANDGIADTQELGGNFDGISAWMQYYTDQKPWLQIALAQAQTVDRVYVSSQGLGSVQTGLRSYDVQVDPGTGVWTTVAQVQGQYFARDNLITFPAQTVAKIRLVDMTVNYSGYGDGLPPTTWPADYMSEGDVWSGQATVYEIEAYGPGTVRAAAVSPLQLRNPNSVAAGKGAPVSWDVRTPAPGATYGVTAGALPSGVSLQASGLITGRPAATGRGTVTVTASAPSGTGSVTFRWSVVAPKVAVAAIDKKSTLVGAAIAGFSGHARDTYATTFRWTQSRLPSGTHLDAASGAVSGKPLHAGTYRVVLTATDAAGAKASVAFAWTVRRHSMVRTGKGGIRSGPKGKVGRSVRVNATAVAVLGRLHEDSARGRAVSAKITYRWYVNGRRIAGAAKHSLHVRAGWRGRRVRFVAVATRANFRTYTYRSPTVLVARQRAPRR